MAEYDRAFIDRIFEMGYEEMLAYLHSLHGVERKAMEEAILRAASQRAVNDHISELQAGLTN